MARIATRRESIRDPSGPAALGALEPRNQWHSDFQAAEHVSLNAFPSVPLLSQDMFDVTFSLSLAATMISEPVVA